MSLSLSKEFSFNTKVVKPLVEKWKFSHAKYVLSTKVTQLKLKTTIPLYKKAVFPVKYRLETWLRQADIWKPTIRGIGEVIIPRTEQKVLESTLAFELMRTPRTAGVYITKGMEQLLKPTIKGTIFWVGGIQMIIPEPIKVTKYPPPAEPEYSFSKQFWRMGKETKYYFEKPIYPTIVGMKEKGLLPLITQTQLTRLGILPYVPKITIKPLSETLIGKVAPTVGLASLIGLKAFVEPKRKPKKVERLKKTVGLKEYVMPTEITAPIIAPVEKEKVAPIVSPLISQIGVQVQALKTSQITTHIMDTTPPSSVIAPSKPPRRPKKVRKRKPKKRKAKPISWYGYEILHPVATESQVSNWILGRK